jgi:antitoxin (DNA-binding transcriptional repressor) of toxin-antitoxin stability system
MMAARITATELARGLGDVLRKVRYRGEVFVIERNGEAVARLGPVPSGTTPFLREGLLAWRTAGMPDAAFADDLERIGSADRPPRNPWA